MVFTDFCVIASYMLVDRFKPVVKPKKTRTKNPTKGLTRDMILYKGLQNKKPAKLGNTNPLHVIKALKLLENFILRRVYTDNIDDLELGFLRAPVVGLIDNLPKLLLDIDNSTDSNSKKKLLDVLFSMVVIYRQFQVKTAPSASTMLATYSGSKDISSLLKDEFSLKNITD